MRADEDEADTVLSGRTPHTNHELPANNAGRSDQGTVETVDSQFVNVSLDNEPPPDPDDSVPSIPANDPHFARHIIDWDPDDPKNPYNWTKWRKFINIFLSTVLTLIVRLGSGMIAP
jgi:hypothetical protein